MLRARSESHKSDCKPLLCLQRRLVVIAEERRERSGGRADVSRKTSPAKVDGRKPLLLALSLTLASVLAGCGDGGTSPEPLSPGLYTCTGKDTLRFKSLQAGETRPSKVQVVLNGIPVGPLKRTEKEYGREYTGRGPTVLWAREETVLLERFGKTRAHGCRALPDSARQEGTQKSGFRQSGFRLGAWFRSPVGLNRHGYLLRYPRPLQVDQHRLRHTRFIYAGPNNEPPALTDGFSLHIGLERTSPDTTLREHSRAQIQNNRRAGGKRVSAFRDTTIRGHKGLFWREKTAMGPVASRLAVGLGPETLASISYTTVGTSRKAYARHVRRMLATLRFPTRPDPPSHINVPLAMLSDPEGASREGTVKGGSSPNSPFSDEDLKRGCDEVVFAYRQIPLTADPLSATLDTLFSIDRDSVGGHRHFLARTNETLSLRGVFREGSTLEVRLEGRLSGLRGMCDHPRARIQIVETARRVGAVDSVALYLNGTPTDLQPGGRGL